MYSPSKIQNFPGSPGGGLTGPPGAYRTPGGLQDPRGLTAPPDPPAVHLSRFATSRRRKHFMLLELLYTSEGHQNLTLTPGANMPRYATAIMRCNTHQSLSYNFWRQIFGDRKLFQCIPVVFKM